MALQFRFTSSSLLAPFIRNYGRHADASDPKLGCDSNRGTSAHDAGTDPGTHSIPALKSTLCARTPQSFIFDACSTTQMAASLLEIVAQMRNVDHDDRAASSGTASQQSDGGTPTRVTSISTQQPRTLLGNTIRPFSKAELHQQGITASKKDLQCIVRTRNMSAEERSVLSEICCYERSVRHYVGDEAKGTRNRTVLQERRKHLAALRTRPKCFSDLPAELRNRIYNYILSPQCRKPLGDVRRCLPLLLVSRQVRFEVTPILYGGDDLRFDCIRASPPFERLDRFISGLGHTVRYLRHMSIDHWVFEDMDDVRRRMIFFGKTVFSLRQDETVHMSVVSEAGVRDKCSCLVKDFLHQWLEASQSSPHAAHLNSQRTGEEAGSMATLKACGATGGDLVKVLVDWKRLLTHRFWRKDFWGLDCVSGASCGGYVPLSGQDHSWRLSGTVQGISVQIEGHARDNIQWLMESLEQDESG